MTIDPLMALVSFLIFGLIFTPLERQLAIHALPWQRAELGRDLLFLFGNFLLWTPLVTLLLLTLLGAVRALPLDGIQVPFATLPWWVQIPLALLLSDLATYWFHRASHRLPWLWRFHRTHHSAPHLDWIAAYREHPVDNLLTRAVENLPLMLLGLPLGWIAGIAAFRGLWALFIHSNINVDPGPLRYLLGSPRLHHWHHEVTVGGTCNFANLDPLMDVLFGTYRDPGRNPETYGDPEQPARSYVGHLLAPLRR